MNRKTPRDHAIARRRLHHDPANAREPGHLSTETAGPIPIPSQIPPLAALVHRDHRPLGRLGTRLQDRILRRRRLRQSTPLHRRPRPAPGLRRLVRPQTQRRRKPAEHRRIGIFWAFLTGILGGVGNLAFFQALVKGGNASVVAPVTALFPMVTVLLAIIFLKERLGRIQWIGLALAFVAIYLLSA